MRHQKKKRKYEQEDFNQEIQKCCRENLLTLLKYFVEDQGANLKTENIYLIIASVFGHKDIVAFLLENEIDVNQGVEIWGKTALIFASEQGRVEIVKMLLEKENIDINQKDKYGWTALMWATYQGHEEIVKMLEAKVKETHD